MNTKKTNALNLGGKGLVMVILSFFSCYLYSALTSDSLNVTIGVFGGMGLNTNALYALSSVATICGVIGSIIFGKISEKKIKMFWAVSNILIAVFAFIWSTAHTVPVYAIGYLVVYTMTLVSSQLLSFNILANWFPRKRGVALGIATAGFPLSAATTTSVCTYFADNISRFYILYGIFALILGIVIIVYVKDFPEEKGAYPDNDKNFDIEAAKKEHEANLAYLATSKWTIKKVLTTGRTWGICIGVCITGFISMGIMSNFLNKFMGQGYELTTILLMLAVVGICAIPGSVFAGWVDVKFGTKAACMMVSILTIIVLCFNLTNVTALHWISLPLLAVELGGSSNMYTSATVAVWGRYDFQNAFRVIQPLNAVMTGIGITTVGIVGTNFGYMTAYTVMLVLAIIALTVCALLKLKPIDDEIR